MSAPSLARDYIALAAFLDARVRAPLAWGDHDCVAFAARAAEAQTGVDYLARIGSTWSTASGAARVLKARGGLLAAVDGLGLARVAQGRAFRGDVGLVRIGEHDSLVVIEGDLVVGPGLSGLVRLPRRVVTTAWTLG